MIAGRRRVALEHLRKSLARAQQFAAAMDTPARPPEGLSLQLVSRVVSHDNIMAMYSFGGEAWPITPDLSYWNGPTALS